MFSTRYWPSDLKFNGEHFESFASVVLRVPGLMLIDQVGSEIVYIFGNT